MTNFISGLSIVSNFAETIVDRLFPDKQKQAKEREQFLLEATRLDNQIAQSQIEVNKQEAASESIFVSGWRPFIGWVCGSAFVYHMIILPVIMLIMEIQGKTIALPDFDTATLNTVLMGLLGLGTMRTVEKIQAMKN